MVSLALSSSHHVERERERDDSNVVTGWNDGWNDGGIMVVLHLQVSLIVCVISKWTSQESEGP